MKIVARNTNSTFRLFLLSSRAEIGPCFGIESITVPPTYYNVYETVDVLFEGVFATFTITIPAGNYTAEELLDYIATQANTSDAPSVYTVSQLTTGPWLMENSSLGTFSVTLPDLLIGYFSSPTGVFVSANEVINFGIIDMTRTYNFRVYCSQFVHPVQTSTTTEFGAPATQTAQLMGIIPVTSSNTFLGSLYTPVKVNDINNTWYIELRDDNDVLIDLNGFYWQVVFYTTRSCCC